MSIGTYSSLAAFLAHYEALWTAPADGLPLASAPNLADAAILDEMQRIIAELSGPDRAALTRDAAASSGEAARHRARAELHLRRLLVARGILAG